MRIQRRFLSFILTLVLSITCMFSFIGCKNNTKINEKKNTSSISIYPLKIKDSYDREVTLNKEPKRIISIAPNITEIIYSLGCSDRLVGRTDYCGFPKEAKEVESIGSLTQPNIEKIVDLKPDLVIASTHFKREVLKKLEDLKINVLVLYGEKDFNGVYDIIEKVGEVLNTKKEANKLITNMKNRVDKVALKVKNAKKPKIYYVISFGKYGEFTAGRDTFINNIIEMAGGDNIAKDITGWQYSIEKIVEKDPDLIICSKYFNAKDGIKKTPGYKDLRAIKNKKLITIDNNLLDRQGPRCVDGLEALAKIIHPTQFK